MTQHALQWRIHSDTRTEYIDTPEGFMKIDTFWFLLKNMQKLSDAASNAVMTMEDLNKMLRVLNET
jgi:hypothetical protein